MYLCFKLTPLSIQLQLTLFTNSFNFYLKHLSAEVTSGIDKCRKVPLVTGTPVCFKLTPSPIQLQLTLFATKNRWLHFIRGLDVGWSVCLYNFVHKVYEWKYLSAPQQPKTTQLWDMSPLLEKWKGPVEWYQGLWLPQVIALWRKHCCECNVTWLLMCYYRSLMKRSKEHIALDRTSWSNKSVWNRFYKNAYGWIKMF